MCSCVDFKESPSTGCCENACSVCCEDACCSVVKVDKLSANGYGSTVTKSGTIPAEIMLQNQVVKRHKLDKGKARQLYVHDEKFNQPIVHCNNISELVEPSLKILFQEGGCGTFVPLFLNLISSVKQHNPQHVGYGAEPAAPCVDPLHAAQQDDPLHAAQNPADEMMIVCGSK